LDICRQMFCNFAGMKATVIYPQTFEQKTGFDRIRQLVAAKCLSSLGRERIEAIACSSDMSEIEEQLCQTDEFVKIMNNAARIPSDNYIDVRPALLRIKPEGSFLDETELFDVKRSLQTIYETVKFFTHTESEASEQYPSLRRLSADVPVFPHIVASADALLDRYGRMKDSASSELQRIRKEIAHTAGSITRNLQSILRSAQMEGIVAQDIAPTMRDGRLVIPVSPAFKRRIKGIVHDESSTGKTVFIEPEAVVEANNRIRELENEEKREIVRILTAITDEIRPYAPDMVRSYAYLAEIDFIRAKALFAIETGGVKPLLSDSPHIDWLGAVHPLLFLSHQKQGRAVVPLDIELSGKRRILLISGPNAGGKSVCLKTVGLLQYMLQCGMLLPVRENSWASVFDKLFIDIGDEQSIENDLSTYSSHLSNMKFFVRNCDARSLLLIDEFGSGTEPLIGGAIAEALIERFNRNKAFGVITTHYQNLKEYAESHEGVVNGAMLYDRHLMQPLFKLSVGQPGSSFAVEIARKTGLPEDVIAEASEKVGSDYIAMDKYLQDIIRDKRYWEMKRQHIRQQEKRLEEMLAKYESAMKEVNSQRKEIIKGAKTEAQQILEGANAQIEKTIREIKEAQAERERTRAARKELAEFKTLALSDSVSNSNLVKVEKTVKVETPEIIKGDPVRLKGQTAIGTAMEVQGKQATIAFGALKSVVSLDKLEKVSRQEVKKELRNNPVAETLHAKRLNFKHEIDVRGMRGDEAVQAAMYFIDDAILAGVSTVRILHGTGEGILRQLIREYLATVPAVKRIHDEDVRLGGVGITVVELAP